MEGCLFMKVRRSLIHHLKRDLETEDSMAKQQVSSCSIICDDVYLWAQSASYLVLD